MISSYGPDKTSFGVPGPRSSAETGYGVAPAPVLEPPSETLAADLTATPGQPAPLAISVRSPRPFEQTLVSISGVPQGARLSAGVDAGNGNWLLPPRRLNGLTITLPPGTPEQIPLEVQLLDSSARTALSEKSRFFIRLAAPVTVSAPPVAAKADNSSPQATSDSSAQKLPAYNTLAAGELSAGASAPPVLPQPQPQPQLQPQPAMPSRPEQTASAAGPPAVSQGEPTAAAAFQTSVAPAPPARSANQAAPTPPARSANQAAPARRPMPSPEVEDLIREGNKRMREGDILEARRYYFKAVASGDPEAALAMGRSYDPIYFARIERKNGEPDPAKALEWYRKAMEGGAVQTAKVRIENLKRFLNE